VAPAAEGVAAQLLQNSETPHGGLEPGDKLGSTCSDRHGRISTLRRNTSRRRCRRIPTTHPPMRASRSSGLAGILGDTCRPARPRRGRRQPR
jgi:hypothetical protein